MYVHATVPASSWFTAYSLLFMHVPTAVAKDHCRNSFNHLGTFKAQHIYCDLFHRYGCVLKHFCRYNWLKKRFNEGREIQAHIRWL